MMPINLAVASPPTGQYPVDGAGWCFYPIFRAAAGHIDIDQPQILVIEKLRCFQAEIMKIAGPIHRRHIHQSDQFLVRFKQLENSGGGFQLVRILRIQRAFAQTSASV